MCSVVKLCLTLCNPMDCSSPGSLSIGILQARILEWAAISFSRASTWTRNGNFISCIASRFFITEPPRKFKKKVILNNKLIIKNWLERQNPPEPLEIPDNFVSCGASVQFYSWRQHVQLRDGLRSESLSSELPTAILVCIWASLPWLWSYFIFILSGLVSSAMGDPLSEQDRRLGHQIFGLCLISHTLRRVLTGKGSMATLFYPSLLPYSRRFSLGCGFSFPLLDFVLFPLLLCPLKLCILAGGPQPHNWPLYSPANTAPSLLSPLGLSVQTTLWELYSVFW